MAHCCVFSDFAKEKREKHLRRIENLSTMNRHVGWNIAAAHLLSMEHKIYTHTHTRWDFLAAFVSGCDGTLILLMTDAHWFSDHADVVCIIWQTSPAPHSPSASYHHPPYWFDVRGAHLTESIWNRIGVKEGIVEVQWKENTKCLVWFHI